MLQTTVKMQVAHTKTNFTTGLNVLVVYRADSRYKEVVNIFFSALANKATSLLLRKGETEK